MNLIFNGLYLRAASNFPTAYVMISFADLCFTTYSGVILLSPGYRAPECRTWNKWKDLQSHKRRRKLQGSFSNLGNNGSRSDKNSTFHISGIIFLLDPSLGQNKIVKNVLLILQYEYFTHVAPRQLIISVPGTPPPPPEMMTEN